MKILFTGATGVIGRRAVPLLLKAGHEVDAVFRADEDRAWIDSTGARPTRLNLLDEDAVDAALSGIDTIAHFATAIPPMARMRKRAAWLTNDQLRTTAAANLVNAAQHRGVARFVQESVTFHYADAGERWIDEQMPVAPSSEILHSVVTAEEQVARFTEAGGTGVTLRLSSLYGPGRASAELVDAVVGRKLPIIGNGDNYVSSLHVADAATALVAAMEAPGGIYNVSDDDPVTMRTSLEALARRLQSPQPRRVPHWVARLALGPLAPIATQSHRVDNGRFKSATGWQPRYPDIVHGWDYVADQATAA